MCVGWRCPKCLRHCIINIVLWPRSLCCLRTSSFASDCETWRILFDQVDRSWLVGGRSWSSRWASSLRPVTTRYGELWSIIPSIESNICCIISWAWRTTGRCEKADRNNLWTIINYAKLFTRSAYFVPWTLWECSVRWDNIFHAGWAPFSHRRKRVRASWASFLCPTFALSTIGVREAFDCCPSDQWSRPEDERNNRQDLALCEKKEIEKFSGVTCII